MTRTIAVFLILFLALVSTQTQASAHGRIDQQVIGPTFGTFQIQALKPYQTFVPAASDMSAIGLGLSSMNPGATTISVTVRADTITGSIVGTTSKLVSEYLLPTTYMEHFEFQQPLLLVPGATYVIQVDGDAAGHGWTDVGYDAYTSGSGFWHGSTMRDFIFQTCSSGSGKPCSHKTRIIDQISRGRGGQCIDFSSDPCSPYLQPP